MRDLSEVEPQFNNPEDSPAEALESVQSMLRSASSDQPLFSPTLLFNKGWLLRLVLNWFARHSVKDHPLSFAADARWFSEALLPLAFLARHRGDKLAENWMHADGVIGHFSIGDEGKADLKLLPEATQFLVLEAKMFSGLSPTVNNARYYDQAARNVACMAEVLCRAERNPSFEARLLLKMRNRLFMRAVSLARKAYVLKIIFQVVINVKHTASH